MILRPSRRPFPAALALAAPLTDLLDARRTLRQVRLDEAGAEHDYAVALAAWQAAVDRYRPPTE